MPSYIQKPTEEGEKKNCTKCDSPLIARMTDYKDYENKLQWQESIDRKAHYTKDGSCKTINTSTTIPEANVTPEPTIAAIITESKLKFIADKSKILWQIRNHVEKTIKEFEITPNGGMIWEMTKIIYNEMYGVPK